MGWGWRRRLLVLALVLAPLAVYWPARQFPFLTSFDDAIHIVDNHELLSKGGNLASFWRRPHLGLYVPVTYTLWGLAARAGEIRGQEYVPDPHVFHSLNLVLHCFNGLLVFLLLLELEMGELPAFAGALLFVWHPIQVETIAWVSALKDLTAGFFSLAALILYLRSHGMAKVGKRRFTYCMATLAFALALLSKPAAVALPLAAAIIDVGFFRRPFSRALKLLLPWFLLAIPIVVLTKWQQPDFTIGEVVGFPQRLSVAADALLFSLSHFFFPFHLSVNYGRTPSLVLEHSAATSVGCLLVILVASLWLSRSRTWGRDWRVGAALFVAFWLPTSGLIPFYYQHFSTVADRFLYLALLGPALAVAAILMRAPTAAGTALVMAGLIFSAVKSSSQLHYWSDALPLIEHMTEINPSPESHYSLAALLAAQGHSDLAIAQYREAIRLNPRMAMAYNNLGAALLARGRSGEARENFRKAISIDPDLAEVYNNMGVSFAQSGQITEAKRCFSKALALKADIAGAKENLARALKQEMAPEVAAEMVGGQE